MTKNTALTQKHIALGAKMIPFAGFNMPVYYSGIIDEHLTVRNHVGVFDVSHMGEFTVKGKGALDFLQYITSNDVSKLVAGKIQYSCFPNDRGGIVDDLLVYMMNENDYMLVVNAANIEKDWDWVNRYTGKYEVEVKNISDDLSQIAIQGPATTEALQKLTDVKLDELVYYTFTIGKFAGFDNIIISATGYTGSGGLEIYAPNEKMPAIWDAVFEAGKNYGIKPIGLGARDTLRLEAGFCLYGNDITDTTSPIEAGLGWITKFTKDFLSKPVFLEQKEKGCNRKLCGIELIDKGIPRHEFKLFNTNNELIGEVTSGTQSPLLDKPIAMGYVKTEYSEPGTEILMEARNKFLKAKIVKLPFYKK